MGFVGNLLLFPAVNSENPLKIDKVIDRSWVYQFFGTQCIRDIAHIDCHSGGVHFQAMGLESWDGE